MKARTETPAPARQASLPPPDRSRLPQPGPIRAFQFPRIEKSATPDGLRVWTARHPGIPVVTLLLLIRRGSASDPLGREGLAALTIDMLDEGSGARSAIAMHEELARLGGQLDVDIGPDAAMVSITVLSRFAEQALGLLADMIVRPSLAEEDFTRVRQLRLHRLTQLRDLPGAVADRAFLRLLYGRHPYGHTPLGSEAALASLSLDDVRAFHQAAVKPSDAFLMAVGDCDHDAISRFAAGSFAGWTGVAAAGGNSADTLPVAPRLNVVPRPGAPQSELRIGHVAVARNTADYHALIAANMVLGGQFVSRINLNLREDKGFTYGARTSFDFRRLPGPFSLQVSVQTTATRAAIEESIDEIRSIRDVRPVTEDELSLGAAALTRGYAKGFETAEQVARALTQIALYDLPDDYYTTFVPTLERVTTADVTRVALNHIHPDRLTTLIVGDLDVIGPELDRLNLGAPVVLSAEGI
jgi:zinc protease